jgi:hypothetical protein
MMSVDPSDAEIIEQQAAEIASLEKILADERNPNCEGSIAFYEAEQAHRCEALEKERDEARLLANKLQTEMDFPGSPTTDEHNLAVRIFNSMEGKRVTERTGALVGIGWAVLAVASAIRDRRSV